MDENEILARANELLQASGAGMNSLAVADCSDEQWAALLGTNEQVLQKSEQVMSHASLAIAECGNCGTVIVPPPPPPPPDVIVPRCFNFLDGQLKHLVIEQKTGEDIFPGAVSRDIRPFASFDKRIVNEYGNIEYTWKNLSVSWDFVCKLWCRRILRLYALRPHDNFENPIWVKLTRRASNVVVTENSITADFTYTSDGEAEYTPNSDKPWAYRDVTLGNVQGMVSQETYDAKFRELNP